MPGGTSSTGTRSAAATRRRRAEREADAVFGGPRSRGFAALAGAVAFAIALGGSGVAEAGHDDRRCGIVSKGSRDYRVHALNLKCRPAKRGVKRFLRSKRPLAGFNCTETDARTPFFCKRQSQAYWAVRL